MAQELTKAERQLLEGARQQIAPGGKPEFNWKSAAESVGMSVEDGIELVQQLQGRGLVAVTGADSVTLTDTGLQVLAQA